MFALTLLRHANNNNNHTQTVSLLKLCKLCVRSCTAKRLVTVLQLLQFLVTGLLQSSLPQATT